VSDYHTLIAQAIDGLDENNTEEARRALYERARSAQIRQLRAIRPPLSESVVAKERLSLENAIRKVETNAARKSGSKPSEQRPAPSPRRDAVREESDQPEQIEQSPIAFGEGGARRPAPPPSARPPTSLIREAARGDSNAVSEGLRGATAKAYRTKCRPAFNQQRTRSR
jgi:hypothetical protein